jgi:hypothetical protein
MKAIKNHWHLISLIFGMVALVELAVWLLYHYEGGPSIGAIPPMMVYVLPFTGGLLTGWKWPLLGSIILFVDVAFWLILTLIIIGFLPPNQGLLPTISGIYPNLAPILLPPFITALLLFFSWITSLNK